MSFVNFRVISRLLVGAGVLGCAISAALWFRLPVAEGRLAVTVQAHPTSETFAGIVSGSETLVATLVELVQFDDFRAGLSASGFDLTGALPTGSPAEQARAWSRAVRVERIGSSLTLRVRARAQTEEAAMNLTGAVLHMLALEAPRIVGNTIVHARIERMPAVIVSAGAQSQTLALLGGSLSAFFLGCIIALLQHLKRTTLPKQQPQSPPSAPTPPPAPPTAPSFQRSSPDEARYWLDKFLEQHQRGETDRSRTAPDAVTTWDDVTVPSRNKPSWLKAPDALIV